MQSKALLIAAAVFGISVSGVGLANTCPTSIYQDKHGYWVSHEKPGWKSNVKTLKEVTLSAQDFGGVVYSPSRKRMACVYKASNGKWIALISSVHHAFKIDMDKKDEAGQGPAWKYSEKHKDYACGKPHVTKITNCTFTFDE